MKRIIESLTPPENTQVMWLDVSSKIKQLKVYINGEWVVVNDDTKNNEEIVKKVLEKIDKDFESYIKKEDAKSLLTFNGIANNDANSALRSGIYPYVTKNVPIDGETFTIQTLRTTTAVYNQYISTQIAIGTTGTAIGKVYIRKNTQKSGGTTYEDWIGLAADTATIYKYVAQQVTNGAWIPVKAGRTKNGVTIVDGAVAEGIDTEAIGECSHAEGKHVTVTRKYGHSEGVFNFNDSSFIRTLGVGTSYTERINAEAVYAKETGPDGLPDSSDPKNGYKYLLGIGGYTGKAITEDMKSVQEVISDLESRIATLEEKLKS